VKLGNVDFNLFKQEVSNHPAFQPPTRSSVRGRGGS
jgi:hypothetical protein